MNLIPWRSQKRENGNRGRMEKLPSLRHEIDHLFDQFFREPFGASLAQAFGGWGGGLQMDLVESDDEVVVKADLPGVDAENVEINVAGHLLTISGERKDEHTDKKQNYHFVECQYGSFHRSVELPGSVDPDKVDASFKNGVLVVKIGKRAEAKARKIRVSGE